ncbi:hypothetical protein ACUH97_08170 [Dermabacteraceae bacterium P13088]
MFIAMARTIKQWISKVTGEASMAAVAKEIGYAKATYSRQLQKNAILPETVVAIARSYKASPLEGLMLLGLLNEDDLVEFRSVASLESATDEELAGEILRRLNATSRDNLSDPVNVSDPASNVTPINRATREELYEGINEEELLNLPYAAATPKDTGEDGDSV